MCYMKALIAKMVVPTSTPIIAVADEAPLTEKYVESCVFIYST